MPKRTKDYREELLKSLLDPEAAANYVNAALEDSEEMLLIALRDVAEAHQLSTVASSAGISRESIYRMLSETGNPRLSSLAGILRAVGLKLMIEPNTTAPISGGIEEQAIAEKIEATTVTAKNVYFDASMIGLGNMTSCSTATVSNQSSVSLTGQSFLAMDYYGMETTQERIESDKQQLAA